jgi:hypothetical protein
MFEKRYNRAVAKRGLTLAETDSLGADQGNGNIAYCQQQCSNVPKQPQESGAQQQGAASATVAPQSVTQANTPTDSDSLGLDI